ncbi:MAG: hypothetical protein O7G88_20395 [bacterium]|nr:hypothetical protein [bacterium]
MYLIRLRLVMAVFFAFALVVLASNPGLSPRSVSADVADNENSDWITSVCQLQKWIRLYKSQ